MAWYGGNQPSAGAQGRPVDGDRPADGDRSFSAVSAPIFARKYAFCSIFQNLPDYLAEIIKIRQNFADLATFAKFC